VVSNFQKPLALATRLLLAFLFLPEGIGKISGFAGIVTYISSAGLPRPELGAVIATLVLALAPGALTPNVAPDFRIWLGAPQLPFNRKMEIWQWLTDYGRHWSSSVSASGADRFGRVTNPGLTDLPQREWG
jgi:hypothetical protein